jgi:hypothetical protein
MMMLRFYCGRRRPGSWHWHIIAERYPGMQHINLSPPLTTPKDGIVEQYRMVGELVMRHFRPRPMVQTTAQ